MSTILSAVMWLAAKIIGDGLLRVAAIKAMAVFLITVVLPIIFNNLLYDIMEILFNYASVQATQNTSGFTSKALEFTGLGAWMAIKLKLPECLSLITAALTVRSILNMIPFVRI